MDVFQIITLALLQGFTEFLPISSSAHLILVPMLTGWQDQGLAFDVAVHVGSLLAVVVYFRQTLAQLITGWLTSLKTRQQTPHSHLAWAILFGTVPVGLAGLLFSHSVETALRSVSVMATTTLVFGVLLWWADWKGAKTHGLEKLNWQAVLFIGLAQAVALIPGVSRSGITITAALALGFSRDSAAQYSFLLSIPVIILAGGLQTLELIQNPTPVLWDMLALAVLLSALTAYTCIYLFLQLINRIGMLPFMLYRLVLGGLLFAWAG
jgi:undecaprenyl-diphosphatase